jgi:hypothetical protein
MVGLLSEETVGNSNVGLAIGFRDYQVKKLALATVVDQGLVTHAFV